jgi:hypothetical protein
MSSEAIDETSARVFHRARSFAVASVLSMALAGGAVAACGGTTGHDNLAGPPNLGSVSADAGADAGIDATDPVPDSDSGDLDAGFDVDIEYADAARLPHFTPSSEAGSAEAGAPPWDLWPQCAPDGIDPATGSVLLDEAGGPLIYDLDPSAAGSPLVDHEGQCDSKVWTTSAACDHAVRAGTACDDPTGDSYFPPCSNLPRDASAPGALAAGGPGKGALKFDLCGNLYTCIMNYFSTTGATASHANVINPFCLDDAGKPNSGADCQNGLLSGPCHDAFENAFESTNPLYIINNVTNSSAQGVPGNEGREAAIPISCMLANALTTRSICFGDAGAASTAPSGH